MSGAASLWEQFAETAEVRGDAAALVLPEGVISFAALAADARRCAAYLSAHGIRRGSIVALQLPKWRTTFALWLACLRQGALYVFMDPRNPSERTRRILERIRPILLIGRGDCENPHGKALTLRNADAADAWCAALSDNPALAPSPARLTDPVYIMFTSGSTGEPKGAVIPGTGVVSLMRWARESVCQPEVERFANLNPLHFDNSVFDLFCGLLNGAALVPVETSERANPAAWTRRLRDAEATLVFAVPTLFQTLDALRLLTPDCLPHVRTFIFGGEGYPVDALRRFAGRFRGRAKLLNVYGPTETSCICSSLVVDDAALASAHGKFPSIGRMHADFDHAILNEAGHPVAEGEPGELWIGGGNVGLGYFADPAETAKRFAQDPRQHAYRSIWYRSGDIVHADADGLLWFHGRSDNQVKVRGHRIELEELDLAIERLDGVRRAVAIAVEGADGLALHVAFSAERNVDPADVRAHCERTLPAYMQPHMVMQLETLPQNANGKVDRRAVRDLVTEGAP